jgi:hypothetical protein
MGLDFHHEIRKVNFKAKITEYRYRLNTSFFKFSSHLTLTVLGESEVCKKVKRSCAFSL